MGNAQKWSVGMAAVGVLLVLGFLLREDGSATRGGSVVDRGALAHAAEPEEPEHDGGLPVERQEVTSSEPFDKNELSSSGPTPEPSQSALGSVFDGCLAAIEESVFGSLDAQTILDAAMASSELDLETLVILEDDGSGRPRFPLLNSRSDVVCEFVVAKSGKAGEQVLALEMKFQVPSATEYLVGPAVREAPKADIQFWFNEDGSIRSFGIMTHLDVSPWKTQEALGTPWDSGTLSEGVHYHCRLGPPLEEKLKTHGLVDGAPKSWVVPLVLTRGWSEDDLSTLGERLLSMYSQVNPKWKEGR